MSDLVKRLRTNAERWYERDDEPWRQDMRDAAEEIERLRDRLGLIAHSHYSDSWARDRAKAALLPTEETEA